MKKIMKKIKAIISDVFGHPLTYILLACLAMGSCIYSGAKAEQRSIKKLTGVELTVWESMNTSTRIILDNRGE